MSNRITIVEVGPRDGFQMEAQFIPTKLKVAVIDQLSTAGLGKIEATSFVSAQVIPQMRDAAEVLQQIRRAPDVTYSVLVPNVYGAKKALQAGANAIRIVVCITESYNRRNVGLSVTESAAVCAEVLELARATGVRAEVVIGVAFGCPLEGKVPEQKVVDFIARMFQAGYREISLADSVGLANPRQVREMIRRVRTEFPMVHLSLHLHDTRGLGLTNVLAGLEEGIDTFDSALGGLGGCPVVPGATGNIPTEDLVNMLDEMGCPTGTDVDAVMTASRMLTEFLGRRLPSRVLSSGTATQLYRRIASAHRATGAS